MDLIAYLRLSRDEDLTKLSPEVQLRAIQEWAARNGHVIVGYFEDRNISGGVSFEDRPGWSRLWSQIKPLHAKGIVCLCLDRLVRDLRNQCNIVFDIKRRKLALFFVQQEFDDSPEGILLMQILGIVAERYRRDIGRKVLDHARDLAGRGVWPAGLPALGYSYDKTTKSLGVNRERAADVVTIFRTFVDCAGKRSQVVRELMDLGIKGQRGRPLSTKTLVQIITNPIYTGAIRYLDLSTELPNLPRIVPPELVDTAVRLFESTRVHRSAWTKQNHVYGGWLTCSECGSRYVGHISGSTYYYCGGRNRGVCPARGISESRLDALVSDGLQRIVSNYQSLILAANVGELKPAKRIDTSVRRNRILDMCEAGLYTLEQANQKLQALSDSETTTEQLLPPLPISSSDIPRIIDLWADWTTEDKRKLLGLLVREITIDTKIPARLILRSDYAGELMVSSENNHTYDT